jgi:hypothetical protein
MPAASEKRYSLSRVNGPEAPRHDFTGLLTLGKNPSYVTVDCLAAPAVPALPAPQTHSFLFWKVALSALGVRLNVCHDAAVISKSTYRRPTE